MKTLLCLLLLMPASLRAGQFVIRDRTGKVIATIDAERNSILRDATGRIVAYLERLPNGSVILRSPDGRILQTLTPPSR